MTTTTSYRKKRERPTGFLGLIRRDLRGRTFRTVSSGTAVAVMVGALFATMLLTSGANYSIEIARNRLGADIIVIPHGADVSSQPFYTLFYTPTGSYIPGDAVQTVATLPGVRAVTPETFVAMFGYSGGDTGVVTWNDIVAIDPHNNFMLKSWLPSNITNPLANNQTILGASVPRWDTIPSHGGRFYGTRLVPQYRLATTGTFLDRVVFISLQTAGEMLAWQRLHPNQGDPDFMAPISFQQEQVSAIFVKVNDGVNPDLEVQQVLTAEPTLQAYTLSALAHSANVRFAGLLSQFSISGALVWGGAVLLVSATTTLAVNERRGEFGLLRSVGATRSFIRRLVMSQSVIVTGLSGAAGIAATYTIFIFFYARIIAALGVPYIPPPPIQLLTIFIIALSAAVLTGVAAAYWPARVASAMEPYDALRQGAR